MSKVHSEINAYPAGTQMAEMALVRMLKNRLCWADKMDIIDALLSIQRDAQNMSDEHKHLFPEKYSCGDSTEKGQSE